MINQDQKDQIVELRAKGYSFSKISEVTGISKPTLIKISQELTDKIKNFKELHKDQVLEKYKANFTNQLEALCLIHQLAMEELSKRSFKTLGTSKLIDIVWKNLGQIQKLSTEDISLKGETNIVDIGPSFKTNWEV